MPSVQRGKTVLRILGLPIRVSPSWFLVLALIIYLLGGPEGWFRQFAGDPSVSGVTYWLLGVLGALGLFASLVAHELAHSVLARYMGIPVKGITLFIFGGVSELGDEPPTAQSEFFMAVVGPLSSVVIAAFFITLWFAGVGVFRWPRTVTALLGYLGLVNMGLAVFNSLPAFPLDGGRVARSVIWGLTGDLRTATRIAAGMGSGFGVTMMILGGVMVLVPLTSPIGGIWLIFIGYFLRQAARGSLQHTIIRQELGGEPVARFMTPNPITVRPELSLREFVDALVLPYHYAVFPVVGGGGRWIGVVNARDPARVDQTRWDSATVGDVARRAVPEMALHPNADAVEALSRLAGETGRRLVVVDGGRPVGIVSLRDLMDFLALKIDLRPGRGGR